MKWGDFDFAKLQLKIQRGVVENRVDRAKNEYREAALPIDQRLAEMLLQWLKEAPWKKPEDWVFASPYFKGEKPYSPIHVPRLHFWPAMKKAGLGEKIGWRTFRRTYSSLLRQLGVDLKVQQELMRHADIRTTMNLYTDSFSEDLRVAHGMVVRQVLPTAVV